MIVYRITFKVKLACIDKVVELFKESFPKSDIPRKCRAYTPNIGQGDVVAIEWEYESLAEYEGEESRMWARPEMAEFYQKILELIETGGFFEVWNVVEI